MQRNYDVQLRTDVPSVAYIGTVIADEVVFTEKFITFKLKSDVVCVVRSEAVNCITSKEEKHAV